jgi:hypothetical protein
MQAVQSEVRCIACGGERMRTLYRDLVSCVMMVVARRI